MRGLREIFILFLFQQLCSYSWAQADTTTKLPLSHELNVHAGSLIKIHGEYPDNDVSTLIEYNISRKLTQTNCWQTSFGTPSSGISFIHAQFGNQSVLGQAIGIIPMLRFEKWKNQTRFSIRAGFGLAWFNKPYDALSNPENLVIGSKFANMSSLQIGIAHPLGKRLRVNLGMSFTHCSDAHVAVPNIGANLVAGYLGFAWCNRSLDLNSYHCAKTNKRTWKRWSPGVSTIFGLHEFPGTIRPTNGPLYFVYGENIFFQNEIKNHRIFSVGLNHHAYNAYRDYIETQELFSSDSPLKWKSHTVVFYLGYEWCYGHVSLFVQAGANIYAPFLQKINEVWDLPKHGPLYRYTANKLGYRFQLHSTEQKYLHVLNPFLSIAVKTNGGTADFLEFSCGMAFNNKRLRMRLNQ
ncbi:MAG: acyloxyacyl hydrolase [Flavobacteriales bacterium]|nr:acyloxyacyl hydrolase [Flavobacteriales bacterium]